MNQHWQETDRGVNGHMYRYRPTALVDTVLSNRMDTDIERTMFVIRRS